MKKRTFKTWQLGIILLLSILVPSSLVIALSQNQSLMESCKGNHNSRKEFYSQIRVMPPVTVTDVSGNRVNYAMVDKAVELGSFDIEPGYSMMDKGFDETHHDGCYAITYCTKHLVILSLEKMQPSQCVKVK